MTAPARASRRSALVLLGAAVTLMVSARDAGADGIPPYVTVSAADASRQVDSGKLLLIDVRTADEWGATGVARRALRISIEQAFDDEDFVQQVAAATSGDRTMPIAVICSSGQRSLRAWNLLVSHGFWQVVHIAEGMTGGAAGPGWIASGLPVEGCALCRAAAPGQ